MCGLKFFFFVNPIFKYGRAKCGIVRKINELYQMQLIAMI